MALLATSFTVEVLLLVFGSFLYTGGLIQKLGGIGMFTFCLQMAYKTQQYVSDLTSTPSNVALFFTPDVQQAVVFMSATLALIGLARAFVDVRNVTDFRKRNGIRDRDGRIRDEVWEMLI